MKLPGEAGTRKLVPHPYCMKPLWIHNVVKIFRQGDRDVRALDGVSLEVEHGRFLAVMGQSGSGKSTLLHLAGGLTTADEGLVEVAGQELVKLSDKQLTRFRRRNIGLIFQSFNLVPTLSAEENVALPLMLERETRKGDPLEIARQYLRDLHLGHRLGHRPDAMSGGEQQRVAIARALVMEPALILADEPTGNLDSENGHIVCELLARLCREGRTIVMVTHEAAVAAYADDVAVMKDGKLLDRFRVENADPAMVASRYQAVALDTATPGTPSTSATRLSASAFAG